jgi:hypothetical protein
MRLATHNAWAMMTRPANSRRFSNVCFSMRLTGCGGWEAGHRQRHHLYRRSREFSIIIRALQEFQKRLLMIPKN